MMYLCLRCNGTGEHEQARDLHRSGGTVPCSDCSGTGKLDERMYQFLKRLGYRVTEEPLPTRSQAEELLAAERARAEEQWAGWVKEIAERKADNAAKDARIKAFVEYEQEAEGVKELYLGQIEALQDKLRMTPQSNMWLQEDSVDKFRKFVMEKGILEGLWEISNMLGSYVDDGTPKPEADYMIKTQLFVDVLTKFYEVEANNVKLHREAREAIRIKRHFKEQSE